MPRDLPDGRHLVTRNVKHVGGRMKTEVEEHHNQNCRYKDSGSEVLKTQKWNGNRWNTINYRVYYHKRDCRCDRRLAAREETHYGYDCRWKRVIDEKNRYAYLYRRCRCQSI